jgi:hypothetical protein
MPNGVPLGKLDNLRKQITKRENGAGGLGPRPRSKVGFGVNKDNVQDDEPCSSADIVSVILTEVFGAVILASGLPTLHRRSST